jgi:ribonuclease VapC
LILDTSAILGIIFREPDADDLANRIAGAQTVGVGAPTLAEASAVLSSRNVDAKQILAEFVRWGSVVVVPFGPEHAEAAIGAYQRYGKGHHPAALNLGDCLAYAVASLAGQPLLCKGHDFPQTDIVLA